MRLFRFATALALTLFVGCGGEERVDRKVPTYPPRSLNLVLVTMDTVRADRVSVQAEGGVPTPALDALAREGIRFDNAITTVPFTLPAHASMMTGLYPPRHGVRENVGFSLEESEPTLAERLRDAGYATAGFVSAFVLDGRWGIGRGFDHYFDDFDPKAMADANLASAQRDGAETLAAASAWLDRRPSDKPFFLWLHFYDAHDPYTPPEPYASRYPGRPYEAEIAYVDDLVGRIRAGLEQRGVLDRTAIVVTSDHGEGLGDHGEQYHGFFVYDTTVRVPLLLRLPGADLAGTKVQTAVSHVDLVPTFLELAGLPFPSPSPSEAALDGVSLLPLAVTAADPARAVYAESLYPLLHYGWAPLRALRDARHKFIEAPHPELYDLAADPTERQNVIRGERGPANALRSRLIELRSRLEDDSAAKPRPADVDEEALAQLAALGYMAGAGGVTIDEENAVERADPKDRISLHQAIMSAQSALGAGDLEAARRRLERVLAEDPGILDAHQMLGSLAAREGRWSDAVPSFQRALTLDPEHKSSLFGLANAYRKLGRGDEALVGFERLLSLAPHDSKAALAAADLLVERGEAETAIRFLDKAAAGRDAPPIVANQLGELLAERGRTAEAKLAFERALAANPELVQARFNLAVLAEQSGDSAGAIRGYEATLAQAPRHFQAMFNLGRLLGASGERDRQIALWQEAIEVHPEFVRGHYYLAKLLMDTGGDLHRAESLVRDGLARDPNHAGGPFGFFLLADILNRQGRTIEAGAALDAARRIETEQAGAGKKPAEAPATS